MNWKTEAKEKLRKYGAMHVAVVNIPEEIKRLDIDAKSIRAANSDTTPVAGGGNRREEALVNNILQRQELTRTLEQAHLWLRSVDRALSALSGEEKKILHRLYIYPQKNSVDQLCKELDMEASSIYRRRDRALEQFTIALYGIPET